jgi:fatty-acyl-CoA synthase
VNVNPAYRARALTYALRHSGVRMLVTATSFRTSDYRAMRASVRNELPALEPVVTIGDEAGPDRVHDLVRPDRSPPLGLQEGADVV